MMKNGTLLFLLLIVAGTLAAQTAALKGRITSGEGPLAGVNVALLNASFGDVTDEEGRFSIENIGAGE